MERALVEARIRKIISFMKNQNLASALEKNISMFNDNDLNKILEFLETWNDNIMVVFLMEKTKQFMVEVEKVKQVKSKIKKVKIRNEEKNEKEIENKEIENLLNF